MAEAADAGCTTGGAPPEAAGPQDLCASAELAERGLAVVWDVLQWRQPARAFALRIDGRVVAYLNRCLHVPVEMDWQPGRFLDHEGRHIVCSMHGATYEAASGVCIAGPCRGRLLALDVREEGGRVAWYPSQDTRPVPFDTPTAAPGDPAMAPDPGAAST